MTTLLSVGGNPYSRGQGPSNELFFGSVDGLLVLSRRPEGWRVERGALNGLHVSSLAEEPRSGWLFAGTHNGGLYASSDGGRTWERRTGGLTEREVYSLAVAETAGGVRIYAGTEPAHLYVSDDLGITWTDLPAIRGVPGTDAWTFPAPPHAAHVKYIAIDPANPETIYACVEQGGLLRSTDAGRSFAIIYDSPATDAHRMTVPPLHPERLYLTRGDWSIGHEGLYLSENGGASWERLFDRSLGIGYPDATLIHPDRPELILVAGATTSPNAWPKVGTAETHMARSRDGGRTWQLLPGAPPVAIQGNMEAMTMHLWAGGTEVFAATTDGHIFYSADEGDTWSVLASGLPAISKAGHWRWRERMAA